MHLLTGLVLAGFLGRRSSDRRRSPLLRATGPVALVHELPGRYRFRVPSLKGHEAQAAALAEQLGKIDAVGSVSASPVTGSVLITTTDSRLEPELLVAAIVRLLGLEREVEEGARPAVARGVEGFAEALNHAVYEETGGLLDLWTAVPLALGILGARQVLTQGWAAMPGGVTLLWWAYVSLLRRR